MKGVIESNQSKQGQNGTYYQIKVAGKLYSCWEGHVSEFTPGTTIAFTEESRIYNGKTYWNMKEVKKVAGEGDRPEMQASINMSYAKDIIVQMIASGLLTDTIHILEAIPEIYGSIKRALEESGEDANGEPNPF